VGHIVRLAAYLDTSRHGVFYFRFPISPGCHPKNKRTAIKVSLGTREPGFARAVAGRLVVAGQAALARPMLRAMGELANVSITARLTVRTFPPPVPGHARTPPSRTWM
jgi:hypothetical protein